MIITIRGTNGSGKSTLVRQVMEGYETIIKIAYPPDRNKRKPMGYICQRDTRRLFIPGHYEIANGGIDTIHNLDLAYKLITEHHALAADVLYEGMNFNDGPKRILELKKADLDIRIIFLNISVKQCIASVRERGHTIDEKTIKRLHDDSWKHLGIFEKQGIPCFVLTRQEALHQLQDWLAIAPDAAQNKS